MLLSFSSILRLTQFTWLPVLSLIFLSMMSISFSDICLFVSVMCSPSIYGFTIAEIVTVHKSSLGFVCVWQEREKKNLATVELT